MAAQEVRAVPDNVRLESIVQPELQVARVVRQEEHQQQVPALAPMLVRLESLSPAPGVLIARW